MQPGILTNAWFEQVVFDSLAWDIFARFLNLAICAGLLYLTYVHLTAMLDDGEVSGWQVVAAFLAIGNILILAALATIRRRPVRRIHGLTQRIVALCGTYLSMAM